MSQSLWGEGEGGELLVSRPFFQYIHTHKRVRGGEGRYIDSRRHNIPIKFLHQCNLLGVSFLVRARVIDSNGFAFLLVDLIIVSFDG